MGYNKMDQLPSDEVLCAMAATGDRQAEECLVMRYQRLVRMCARPFFLCGGDSEDLIQEAMFGLIRAIREFDAQQGTTFRTFAQVCIRNRIRSAVTSAACKKHSPLNDSVPIDTLLQPSSSLEETYIDREEEEERLTNLKRHLSRLEGQILALYLQGLSYEEIGHEIEKPVKSVDNAVQRIRRKLADSVGVISES